MLFKLDLFCEICSQKLTTESLFVHLASHGTNDIGKIKVAIESDNLKAVYDRKTRQLLKLYAVELKRVGIFAEIIYGGPNGERNLNR